MSKKSKKSPVYQIRVNTDGMSQASANKRIETVRKDLNKSGFTKRFGDFIVTDHSVDLIRLS